MDPRLTATDGSCVCTEKRMGTTTTRCTSPRERLPSRGSACHITLNVIGSPLKRSYSIVIISLTIPQFPSSFGNHGVGPELNSFSDASGLWNFQGPSWWVNLVQKLKFARCKVELGL